jgi:hypothetical protein
VCDARPEGVAVAQISKARGRIRTAFDLHRRLVRWTCSHHLFRALPGAAMSNTKWLWSQSVPAFRHISAVSLMALTSLWEGNHASSVWLCRSPSRNCSLPEAPARAANGHRNRGNAMSFEEEEYWATEYWATEYRTGIAARLPATGDTERETLFLVRHRSDRYMPRSSVASTQAPQRGFDTERPEWLSRPDFTPADTSQPMLSGPEAADIDVTRPELWMNDDGEFSSIAPSTSCMARLSLIPTARGRFERAVGASVARREVGPAGALICRRKERP